MKNKKIFITIGILFLIGMIMIIASILVNINNKETDNSKVNEEIEKQEESKIVDINNDGIDDNEQTHYKVSFETNNAGKLEGTLEFDIVENATLEASGIQIPTPIPDKYYKFIDWEKNYNRIENIMAEQITEDVTYMAYFDVENDKNKNGTPDEVETKLNLNKKLLNKNKAAKYESYGVDINYNSSYYTLNINENKKSATIKIAFDMMNMSEKLTGKKTYNITGFSKEIKKCYIGTTGQTSEGDFIFFVMSDNTIEYVKLFKDTDNLNLKNGKYVVSKLDNVKDIKHFYTIGVYIENGGGWATTIGVKENNDFYDIGELIN